ncbi:MAG TPA: hypothetical protein VMW72_10735 [Sedimentisphaerales bacterium]|nr:hypothetical protein [Sedimentisphaerales bacterium]
MKNIKNIEKLVKRSYLKNLYIPADAEMDERILGDAVTKMEESRKTKSVLVGPHIWRIIMNNRITKLAAAAVIFIAMIILGINYMGTPIDGASTVFAAAMDSIKQARTFSCITIFEATYEDEGKDGKYLSKTKKMFKEPNRERRVQLTSPWPRFVGEIRITDFKKRQELTIRPAEKTAILYDKSSDYYVDDNTGELKLTELNTSLRDYLLKLSEEAVEDLGNVELDGQQVRMLQTHKNSRVTAVWIDLETNFPVQIEHKWPDQIRSPVLYKSIQIDTELDDSLFSLEPPEGYDLRKFTGNWPDDKARMGAKIMHLGKLCLYYVNKHNGQFPSEFVDLLTSGIVTDEVLKKVLAAPEEPNGTPVFRYRKPDTNAEDRSIEIMLYEVYEEKSVDDLVVVTMLDSHSELLPVQTLIHLLKPWPDYKKKLSLKMTHLHWGCIHFAKEHEGKYPREIADLAGGKFSEEIIKRLQAAPNQPDGPTVIRYRPPHADADPSKEVILYELYDQWSNDGAVVCYANGDCEIITNQKRFEDLTR